MAARTAGIDRNEEIISLSTYELHRRQQTPRSAPSTAAEMLQSARTACARAHTTLNNQNVARVSQTAVTLNACYSRIFTKCCSTLL